MIVSKKMLYAVILTAFALTFLVFEIPREQDTLVKQTTGTNLTGSSNEAASDNIRANVETTFNSEVSQPVISDEAHVDADSAVIGKVEIASKVYVGPFASIRGDEGQGLFIGEGSNIQDGVVIHALETEHKGKPIEDHLVNVDGKKWAVYIGQNVSVAHQAQVHGPAVIEKNVFVGMQSLVFNARVGKDSVIEPGAKVIGVRVPDGTYVPAGKVVTSQKEANALPKITKDYQYQGLNEAVTTVNQELAEEYLKEK